MFHPWPEDKLGGSDPDRCPRCDKTTYARKLRRDKATRQWVRPSPETLTCSDCGHVWKPDPIREAAA